MPQMARSMMAMILGAFTSHALAQNAPPTRPADAPGAPTWTVVPGAGKNAPVDADGNFLIGPDYVAAERDLDAYTDQIEALERQLQRELNDGVVYDKGTERGDARYGVPLGREQTPEDIGELAAFLASDAARNITGQWIAVDGGITLRQQ